MPIGTPETALVVKSDSQIAIEKGFDLATAIITNPLFSMIAGVMIIETSQGLMVFKGNYHQEWNPYLRWNPLTERMETIGWETVKTKEPLISQGLATTMESVVISTQALQSIGGIGEIGKLLLGLLKK